MIFKLIVFILSVVISGCGKAPDLSSASDVSTLTTAATDTPVTVVEYAYTQGTQFCAAMKVWDKDTTSIKFHSSSGSALYGVWVFAKTGITQTNSTGDPVAITYTTPVQVGAFPFTCVVSLTNGTVTGVQ